MTTDWEAMAREAMGEEDQPKRHLKVIRASDIGMEATEWMWEDEHGQWIPQGSLSLIAGREGVGKSTIEADIVAHITRGTLLGVHYNTPRCVIVCATEDSWKQTINPRLTAAGADLTKVFRVDAYTVEGFDGTLQLPEDIEEVRGIVAEHDVVLIALDPLMSALSVRLDSHKDAEVRRGLEPLSRLAHDANLTVIGLIHENKSSASDLLSRIMGSRAFTSVVRAVLYAARRDQDENDGELHLVGAPQFVFGQIKSNLGRMVPYALRYHIDGMQVGYDERKKKPIWSSHIVWEDAEDQINPRHCQRSRVSADHQEE
jgi:RecA-family ATPase